MVVNKRKKVTRYRAHTTHGGGHRKKRRGAGNHCGRGKAGSGKRGKGKKPSSPKLGKHGFTPRGSLSQRKTKKIKTLNVGQLQTLIQNKKIAEKDALVNLASFGYQKLLGTGKINLKLKIKIDQFSKQAEEKIKAVNGSIISPAKEEVPEE